MQQDEFIKKAVSLGTHYDFSLSIYKGLTKPVNVICPKHGEFQITPHNLFKGRGCKSCSKEKHQARMLEEMKQAGIRFLERGRAAYGDKYGYSLVEYKGHNVPVKIICPIHGIISITPDSHMVRFGCKQCGIDKKAQQFSLTDDEFVKRVISQNSDYYPISKTKYVGYHERTWFGCSLHGEFMAGASSLMKGRGCQSCSKFGYRTSEPGTLYVLKTEHLVKVGITNRSVEARVKGIAKSCSLIFEVVKVFNFKDGQIPFTIEKILLKGLRATHLQPVEKFDGSTECFYDVDVPSLLSRIEQLILELTPQETLAKMHLPKQTEGEIHA